MMNLLSLFFLLAAAGLVDNLVKSKALGSQYRDSKNNAKRIALLKQNNHLTKKNAVHLQPKQRPQQPSTEGVVSSGQVHGPTAHPDRAPPSYAK